MTGIPRLPLAEAALVAARLGEVRARIDAACARAGRAPGEVRLVAVSKGHPPAALAAAFEAGQRDFGENYVQEWLAKRDALAGLPGIRWHFVGHVQGRKAREVAGRVALLHSLDRLELARELDRRGAAAGASTPCLLEVDLGREATKSGFAAEDVGAAAAAVAGMGALSLEGLMAIPPPEEDPERARLWFRELRALRDRARHSSGLPLPELSMGMSADYAEAIEEGATLVRVGTAIFGPRPARPPREGPVTG